MEPPFYANYRQSGICQTIQYIIEPNFINQGDEQAAMEKKVYADKDVYNENGILLVAKDELLTAEIQKRLSSIGVVIPYPKDSSPGKTDEPDQKDIMKTSMDNLQKKISVDCADLLAQASDILTDVLFQSKSKAWWAAIYALENYVDWLYTHCIDVSLLSTMAAIQLNFSDARLTQLALGSFLHDVGKLLIPKSIIQKPRRLTREEFTLMQQHCVLGTEILRDSGISQTCLNIILQHHERLDGRGYPYALKGDQISDEAQIVMIADVLDAMTSYRPYKNSKSICSAFSELKRKETLYNLDLVKQYAAFLIPRKEKNAPSDSEETAP
jgi:uncharacterized domain HDIG